MASIARCRHSPTVAYSSAIKPTASGDFSFINSNLSWLEDKNANVYNFKVDYEQLTKEIEIVFDALVGQNSWAGMLESIANDTNGPKINLRREVVDNLGNQIKIFAYDAELLTSQAQRVLFAVGIKDSLAMEQTLGKFMSSGPHVQRTKHLGITIFFASDKQPKGMKNVVPIPWGCCVAYGHLLIGEKALVVAALDRGFAKK